VDVPLVSL